MALEKHTDKLDSPSLKRAFTPDSSSPLCASPKSAKFAEPLPSPSLHHRQICVAPRHRRSSLDQARRQRRDSKPSMSGAHGAPQNLPSFASVFGDEAKARQSPVGRGNTYEPDLQHTQHIERVRLGTEAPRSPLNPDFQTYHQPRGSTSTSNSDNSEDSSPTTTVSTLDSSSMTDPSPSVSPESPASKLPPAYFQGERLRLRNAETDSAYAGVAQQMASDTSPRQFLPAKKGRNLKNLAVNTNQAYALGKAISTAQFPLGQANEIPKHDTSSAPASPAFIKPPTPPKRKQATLGLSIPAPEPGKALPTLTIPQTPSFKRPNTLRHFQSSPSLPLLSSGLPPESGMQLPPINVNTLQPRGFAEVPMEDEEEPEPNFDIPQSREDKPEAYPDGPIRIYESGVDLYLEPTAEIASRYDVIFNVASEVKNPFAGLSVLPMRPQMSSTVGVLSKESQQQHSGSPTTPKATPLAEQPPADIALPTSDRPEYIHIPWEHNTDIVPDLYRLVEEIDTRVQQGKRVLVHCQCGVSRSASLIVAYGLYKNPELSVQEAYNAVKKRSKWIGPNMNLIMQLQEFKAGLQRQGTNQYMYGLQRKMPAAMSPVASSPGTNPSRTPRSAPLHLDASPQRASTGNMPFTAGAAHRGPLPAFFDPNFRRSWDAGKVGYDIEPPPMPTIGTSAYVNPKGQVIPVHKTAAEQASADQPLRAKQLSVRKSVPNFSKRLPLRNDAEDVEMGGTSNDTTPALPVRTSVIIPSITAPRPENNFNMFAPVGFESLKPRRRPQELRASKVPAQATAASMNSLVSPRSEQFAMAPLSKNRAVDEDTHDLFSPMASHFPVDSPQIPPAPAPHVGGFAHAHGPNMSDLTSPRSDTFGMIGFSHLQGEDDAYGVMSPLKTTFGGDPWASILSSPPSDGHDVQRERSETPHQSDFERRSSTPPALTDASSPDGGATPSPPPTSRHLPTPPRTLKPKFSSPNLAEQRRLQQLQSELEAQLPHSSPKLGMPVTEALMSPRATEFTSNPFHGPVGDDGAEMAGQERPAPEGQQAAFDPRSPAQSGISPITRNIYDVL